MVAADVGYGLLVWRLRTDERVLVHDRTNVRALTPEDIGGPVDLVVADLSFISLRSCCPRWARAPPRTPICCRWSSRSSRWAGNGSAPAVWCATRTLRAEAVLAVVAQAAGARAGTLTGVVASPLPGPSGNVEYFVWLRRGASAPTERGTELSPAAVTRRGRQ